LRRLRVAKTLVRFAASSAVAIGPDGRRIEQHRQPSAGQIVNGY